MEPKWASLGNISEILSLDQFIREYHLPTLSELTDLYQEEKALKVKAMALNNQAFATRVVHSLMRNNDPVVKELIPEDTLKAIAKDMKSNS